MKTEDLQEHGLTEEQIKFVFAENGKDIAAEKKRADKAETDRDMWKGRAETAETTLKGFDGKDFEAIQKERDDWKEKAEKAEKDYNDKIYERDFSDALNAAMDSYSFTSEYAKKAVMEEIKAAGLKLLDGKIIGLNDMVENIKSKDGSAFVTEEQLEKAKFATPPIRKPQSGAKYTPEQLMKMKNENPSLDISQYI